MESDILQVRFTDKGKKYIRKFVSISYMLFCVVFITSGITIYLNIKYIIMTYDSSAFIRRGRGMSYLAVGLQILSLISNIFYIRFPVHLLRSLDAHDELGANRSFSMLFKGAVIYLITLFLTLVLSVWNMFFSIF